MLSCTIFSNLRMLKFKRVAQRKVSFPFRHAPRRPYRLTNYMSDRIVISPLINDSDTTMKGAGKRDLRQNSRAVVHRSCIAGGAQIVDPITLDERLTEIASCKYK